MLGAQALGPDAQRRLPQPSLSIGFANDPYGLGLELRRATQQEHSYLFGSFSLIPAPSEVVRQQHLAEAETVNRPLLGRSFDQDLLRQLRDIAAEISSSEYILELAGEDEGEEIAFTEQTWSRAVILLMRMSKMLLDEHGRAIDAPRILPGPHGSIDIHWDTENYELLLNVPVDATEQVTFYGDNREKSKIKGSFDPDKEIETALLAYRTLQSRRQGRSLV